jgi:hypothetical protein
VLRSHPVSDVSFFFAQWPWSEAAEVAAAWQAFAPHAPDELFSLCSFSNGAGAPLISCFGQYLGGLSPLGALLRPLARVAGASLSSGSSPYLDAQLRWAGCLGKTVAECHLALDGAGGTLPRDSFYAKSDYFEAPIPFAGLATIVDWIERAGDEGFGSVALLLDSYGGAINRVPAAATAFVHRDALCSGQYIAHWAQPADAARAAAWLSGFHTAMAPYASGFAYQNYIDPELADWRHAYYGSNYPRLAAIKAQVDPAQVFRFAQSITPS